MSLPLTIQKLAGDLENALHPFGIRAHVKVEEVRPTKFFRFIVIADEFEHMGHSERQNIVWRIVEKMVSPSLLARVSAIFTLTLDEMGEEQKSPSKGHR